MKGAKIGENVLLGRGLALLLLCRRRVVLWTPLFGKMYLAGACGHIAWLVCRNEFDTPARGMMFFVCFGQMLGMGRAGKKEGGRGTETVRNVYMMIILL